MKRSFLLFVAMSVMAGSLAGQAKHPNTRAGFWWGIGGGWGSASATCEDCDDEQVSGFAGNLRLGGTISPNFLLGVETNGWYHAEGDNDQILRYGSIVAVIYPSPDGGFYFKVGLGVMNFFAETGLGELTATAGAGMLGAGYEFRVGRNMSIVPFLNALTSAEAEYEIEGISVDTDVSLRLFQLGVGVTWH